eukprot:1759084-Karenia_brevis.AAC.1
MKGDAEMFTLVKDAAARDKNYGYTTATDQFVKDLGYRSQYCGARTVDGDLKVVGLEPRVANVARNRLS